MNLSSLNKNIVGPMFWAYGKHPDGTLWLSIGHPHNEQAIVFDAPIPEQHARLIIAAPLLRSAMKLAKRYVDEHCEDLEAHAEALPEQALQKFHSLPIWQRAMATRQAVNEALTASDPQP